jgi:DNA invertase Pin-like site-specific DNA recombinase
MGPSEKKRAAIYLRVSTGHQDASVQRPQVEEMLKSRGYSVTIVYEDVESGAVARRAGWDRCLADAACRKFDVIGVAALDRVHRSMSACIGAILQTDRLGVPILSVREPWLDTTDSPVRSLLIAIFGWVAEQDRAVIRSRTLAGLAKARKAGKRLGRPKAEIDLVRARAMYSEGAGLRKVARALGIGASTLSRALRADDQLRGRQPPHGGDDAGGSECADDGGPAGPLQVRETTLAA